MGESRLWLQQCRGFHLDRPTIENWQGSQRIKCRTCPNRLNRIPLWNQGTAQPILVATSGSDRICSNILVQKLDPSKVLKVLGTERSEVVGMKQNETNETLKTHCFVSLCWVVGDSKRPEKRPPTQRHLVTSGFSEMEATCNARPPKKFCLNKSEGPGTEAQRQESWKIELKQGSS